MIKLPHNKAENVWILYGIYCVWLLGKVPWTKKPSKVTPYITSAFEGVFIFQET